MRQRNTVVEASYGRYLPLGGQAAAAVSAIERTVADGSWLAPAAASRPPCGVPLFSGRIRCWPVLALWCVSFFSSLRAEDAGSPWFIRVWKSGDGLGGNYVAGVIETPDSFLWVVAGDELDRFDGVSFQRFPSALFGRGPAEKIREFTRLHDGGLAFALTDGAIARAVDGHIQVFSQGIPDTKARVATICETPDGTLWLSYHDESAWKFQPGRATRLTELDGLPPAGPVRFMVDHRGQLWFVKGNQIGILRRGHFEIRHQFPGAVSPRVASARDGGIWMAQNGLLFRLDETGPAREIAQIPPDTPARVTALLEDHAGNVWLGTNASGLFRFNGKSFSSVPVSHRVIVSLSEDHEGSIWAGTSGGGLNQIQPRALTLEGEETGVPTESVKALCEDAAGRLWGMTQNGILVARHDGAWKPERPGGVDFHSDVRAIATDAQGALWIATRRNGEIHHWQDGRLTTWGRNAGLSGSGSRTLLVSKRGDVWIGSGMPAPLQRLRNGKATTIQLPDQIETVRSIAEDAAGDIWITPGGRRLLRVTPDDSVIDESHYTAPVPRPIRLVQTTPDGAVWLGYDQGGVGRIKDGKFGRITAEQGLIDDNILLVFPDGRGWIWFAGVQSIFKARETDLAAVAEGRAARIQPVYYGRDQGVRPVFGSMVGALLRSDGRVCIPTATALVIIDTSVSQPELPPAQIAITDVKIDERIVASFNGTLPPIGGEPLSAGRLRLPPAHRRLDFDFTALSFRAPGNMHFRYRLENFDERWIDAGTRRTASYPHLGAGDYHFRVKASNSDGVWNEAGITLAFAVNPFFWETWWFRVTALVVFTAVVFVIARYVSHRRLRLKLRAAEQEAAIERERARIARDIHDDLGSRLTKISLLSGLVTRDRGSPEKSNERIREISETARQVLKSLDETVWAVNPRNDTLPHLIDYTAQFAMNFLRTAEIACQLDLPDDPPAIPVSAEVRHQVFLAVKEALNNVVRHAHATRVTLHIRLTDSDLVINLSDDGQGFAAAPDDPNADGLRNLQQRMTQIGGRCEVRSEPGAGTHISFVLPRPAAK
jgi:signal transduction histidine kinase/ligand-binding sensor domain-containing protein